MTLLTENITYFIGEHTILKEISLQFQTGILYGILGPNGSGKSTLLKTLSRIWSPTQGKLFWQNQDLLKFSRMEMSRTLSLVPQNPSLYFDFSVSQMVSMGRYPQGCRTKEAHERVEAAMQQVDICHLRHQMLSQLSGGERQRVYIARALATEAPILLLDEPTSYLDLRHQLEIWHLLRTLVKQGKLIIVAVHDLLAARRFCDELVILNHGRCQATGSYQEVMTPALLQTIFGVKLDEHSGIFELYEPHGS